MDYTHLPVTSFFRGFVLKTPEGWLCILGSVFCVLWGLLLWLAPSAVPTPRNSSQGLALGFVFMPLVLVALLIKFAQPSFRSSLLTNAVLLTAIGLPFYAGYLK